MDGRQVKLQELIAQRLAEVLVDYGGVEKMKAILDPAIAHLGRIKEFREKVQRTYENKKGETFRVKWRRPYGWVRFVPDANGDYEGFLEGSSVQQTLTKWVNESTPYPFNSRKCGSCVYLTLPIRGLQKYPKCLLGLKPETCDGPFLADLERHLQRYATKSTERQLKRIRGGRRDG